MLRMLVVEDNRLASRVMCAHLRANGYEAIPACDGEEALEMLDREHVDLMIAGVMMLRMDGYELTYLLQETGNPLPILMLTARNGQTNKRHGFLVGTDNRLGSAGQPQPAHSRQTDQRP